MHNNCQVLIIDNNPKNCIEIISLLQKSFKNFSFKTALCSQEVAQKLSQSTINLIILNISSDFISHQQLSGIPIILITDNCTSEEFKQTYTKLQAFDYLQIPIDEFQIIDKITRFNHHFSLLQRCCELENKIEKQTEKNHQLEKVNTEELHKTNCQLELEISERKKIEDLLRSRNRELARAMKRAEESDYLKSCFLANMSHEIRTPMNSILGFTDLLNESSTTSEEKNNYIKLISKSGRQLLALINDIVDLSKIEAGQIKLNAHPFNLNDLLNDIITPILRQQKKHSPNINIIVDYGLDHSNASIVGDMHRIKQILINLISNAIKFTEQGEIRISYTLANKQIQFRISDTGIGIEQEYLEKIFDRFIRQEKSFKHKKYSGTGLGLAICKELTKLMNGTIAVSSKLNQGSTFYFSIPHEIPCKNESTKDQQQYLYN